MKLFVGFLIILSSFQVFSQVKVSDTTQLETVTLKTTPSQLSNFITTSVSSEDIQSNNSVILTPILNQIPGVSMQQGTLNTNRITIRGIGARSQFSTNRLKLYINDVPLTNANGISVLEDIDLNSLGQLSVIKGPKSSVLGANLGGNIILKTQNKENTVGAMAGIGSYDRYQLGFNVAENLGQTQLQAYANHIQSHEYRDNADYERQNFTLLSDTELNSSWHWQNLMIFTRLKAFIPSSLSLTDFKNNPQKAADNWNAAAGFESYDKLFLATTLNHKFKNSTQWITSVSFNLRDAYEPRPFDILDEKEIGLGLRSRLQHNFLWNAKPIITQIGFEWQTDWYEAQNFDNLFRNTPERGSIQGDLVNAFDQNRMRFNAFLTANYNFTERFEVSAGLNLNFAYYETDDQFLDDGLNQSGDLQYDPKLLPNLNFSYNFKNNFDVFANYSMGIATPSIDESLDDEGFFNPNLQPSFGHNFEIGSRWISAIKTVDIQLNLFRMYVEDLIVARRIEEDRFVGINAGKTQHTGVEFSAKIQKSLSENFKLKAFANVVFNDFEFTDFVENDEDFSGNQIPAIPEYDLNFGFQLFYKQNWSFRLNTEWVGRMPLNDANTLYTKTYELVNLNFGHQVQWFNTQTQFSFGLNNVLDKDYAASVLPNAVGFGGAEPRYFYPGMPRQFYFKVLVDYEL
ncbi:TonB-dependent receptor [Mesohalobacter salilacus]|uniref:TonB-dependent receptor n=1 Tax=Mesohalobacter salilacus TaxID=2491711 RepID=UPI00403EB732